MDRTSAATYVTVHSKPIAKYYIWVSVEEETEYNNNLTMVVNELNHQINIATETANSDNNHTKKNRSEILLQWTL